MTAEKPGDALSGLMDRGAVRWARSGALGSAAARRPRKMGTVAGAQGPGGGRGGGGGGPISEPAAARSLSSRDGVGVRDGGSSRGSPGIRLRAGSPRAEKGQRSACASVAAGDSAAGEVRLA